MAAAGLVLGATLALGIGCEPESKLNVVVEEGQNALHVNLPAVPTLPPPPPANHPDGAFTIYGVRHAALRDPSLFTKQQRVRGFIVSVYTPRVEEGPRRGQVCTQRDRCNEERPRVYIADARTERKRRPVQPADPAQHRRHGGARDRPDRDPGVLGDQGELGTAEDLRQAAGSGWPPAANDEHALGTLDHRRGHR